jgi:hypothetical protein
MRSLPSPLLLLALLPLVVFACYGPVEPEPEPEPEPATRWDAAEVNSVVAEVTDGQLTLTGVPGADELELLSLDGVEAELAGGVLTLVADGDLALALPPGPAWSATAIDGAISVSDLDGDGQVRSTRASVSCVGAGGSLDVQVDGDASVGIQTTVLAPAIAVESQSGAIQLDLAAAVSASLSAHTGEGAVEISGVDFDGTHLGADVEGELGAGEGSIRLITGVGYIGISGS